MRALVFAALLALGCGTHPCAPHTLFLSLELSDAAVNADFIDIVVAVGNGAARSRTVAHKPSVASSSVELDFTAGGYPANQRVTVTLLARRGSTMLATSSTTVDAPASCLALNLTLSGMSAPGAGDMSESGDGTDMSGPSAAPDLSGSPPDLQPACVPSATSCPATMACGTTIPDGCGGTVDCGRCQLLAVEPAIASSGAAVRLEGTFGPSTTVVFPGGATAPATLLSPHRASVIVPATAGSGALSIVSGANATGSQPFRRTSFTPSLGQFQSNDGQADAPRITPALRTPRVYHSSCVIGSYLYVIGGFAGANLDSVEQATIGADGSLSSFRTPTGVKLTTQRNGAASLVIGSWLYVFGGGNATVERAAIASDGSLSAFALVPDVSLTGARTFHSATVVGNSVYVIGGIAQAALASVERATIGADGSLSAFAVVPNLQLVAARLRHGALVSGDWLYVLGGSGDSSPLGSVERASIASDGSLGSFATVTGVALTTPRDGFGLARLGDALYVVGGDATSGPLASGERAAVASDGSLGNFSAAGNLASTRQSLTVQAVGNFLYAIGGYAAGGYVPAVERATFYSPDTPGSFSASASTLATGRYGFATAVAGNSVYAISGANGAFLGDVERATLGSDGQLGSFATIPGVTLNHPRYGHRAIVLGNTLYVLGGGAPIEQATIKADGSLSAFVDSTATMSSRDFFTAAVVDNWLFLVGGGDNTVERAAIGSDGSLASFQVMTGNLTTVRGAPSGVVVGRTIFVIGGRDANGTILGSVEQATIAADGSVPNFALSAATLLQARADASAVMVGDDLYIIGGYNNATLASVERAAVGNGTLASFSAVSSMTLPTPLDLSGTVVLDNWLYVIGGPITNVIERAELH